MKKVLIGLSLIIIIPILLLVIALSSLNKIVTEEFMVKQLESNLNVRAEIKKINISLLSAVSSITVDGLKLSRRDSIADNATPLSDRKPLEGALIAVENFDFQLNFIAILSGEIQLKKLLLKNPNIQITLFENGSNNLSSLFLPPKIVEGKPNEKLGKEEEVVKEESKEGQEEEEDKRPFSIKEIPLSANLKEIGVQGGVVNIVVQKTKQKMNIESLNLIINTIDIIPDDLKNHNSVNVDFNFILKVISLVNQEEKAKLILKSVAKVAPFIPETGTVNPIVNYKMILVKDSFIEGSAIFDALSNSMPVLKNAGIEPKGITDKAIVISDVPCEVQYSAGNVKFLNDINVPTKNYDLELSKGSSITIPNSQHTFNAALKLSKEESDKSLANVQKMKTEKAEMAQLADSILAKVTKDDRLYIPFKSSGDLNNPSVTVDIELPSLMDSVKGMIQNKVGEELKKQLDGKVPGGGDLIKKIF